MYMGNELFLIRSVTESADNSYFMTDQGSTVCINCSRLNLLSQLGRCRDQRSLPDALTITSHLMSREQDASNIGHHTFDTIP